MNILSRLYYKYKKFLEILRLRDLMVENVIGLNKDATMRQAADMFLRYGFRALPITDENDIILGVVPYRDVMNLKHRILE